MGISEGNSKTWINKQLGRLYMLNLGYKQGFAEGINSSWGFIKSLGTAQGWKGLGQGFVDSGTLVSLSPEGVIMRAQMATSVYNYGANIPNMSAYEVGYDLGYGSEKIAEIIITRRVVPLPKYFLGVRNVGSASRFTTIQSISTYGKFGRFSKRMPTFLSGYTLDRATFINRNFIIPGGRVIGFSQLQYLQKK